MEEDSHYSFKRANQIWPKLFPDLATYIGHTASPQDFFNYVYANRNGNGPINSGDGYRYRGRGWIQLTLKKQYWDADSALNLGLIDHPERASDPQVAADIACWYCATHGCLEAADKGPDNFKEVVRCINRGLVDLELRTKYFKAFLAALQ
jgi:putative chitinase